MAPKVRYSVTQPFYFDWPVIPPETSQELVNDLIRFSGSPFLVIGCNSVTAKLQNCIDKTGPCLTAVFVCKSDLVVPHYYAHLPTMVQLSNPNTLLIPLSVGSEQQLATAFNVDSASVIGVMVSL